MVFVNEYTISDIINSIILLFSLIGILLTLFTLLEMKKQRRISIIPKLLLCMNDEKKLGILFPDKIEDRNISDEYFGFIVKNVGNGSTNWIQINYHINEKLIDSCWCKKRKDNRISINTRICTFNTLSEEATYSTISANNELKIYPEDITYKIYAIMDMLLVHNSKKINSIGEILDINIKYYDVMGNMYISKYEMKIETIGHEIINGKSNGTYIKFNIYIK